LDANKGITSITYNYLNLPQVITFNNSGNRIEYIYSALGTKLSKIYYASNVLQATTDYISGTIYENGILKYGQTSEGRFEPNGSGGYKYVYDLKDHLGNVRMSFDKGPDGKARIVQEDHYYPFGLTINSSNFNYRFGTSNEFLFSGKEKEEELGLDWYDFGVRFYDPAIGRWHAVDPHAERYTEWSPYNYCFNNPLIFSDPDGRDPIYGKNLWGRTKLIGDDGKDDGQSYLVRGAVKRDVKSSTKRGENYTGLLTESNKVIKIPTGGVMDDVISSVNDTETSEKEHGGHAKFGDANATRWDEGTPAQEIKDASGNVIGARVSLNPFMVGGESQIPTDASNLEYWWHTHPKTSVGGLQLGSSNPSPADFSFQTTMENRGFKGNTFVIGVRSRTVTFYNKDKVLITIRYADFKRMGGK